MLTSLRLKNFAIFDEEELSFGNGFSVLTGETGAGKSILVDAISLVLGKKASDDYIKVNCDYAVVEGAFKVHPDHKKRLEPFIDFDDDFLVVYRRLDKAKGNIIRLNGQTVSLKQLKEYVKECAVILGQHETLYLLNSDYQQQLFDAYLGVDFQKALTHYKTCFQSYKKIKNMIAKVSKNDSDNQQKLEYLNFQIQDITQHAFVRGEETILEEQKKSLKQSEYLKRGLEGALLSLEGICEHLSGLDHSLSPIQSLDTYYVSILDTVKSVTGVVDEYREGVLKRITTLEHLDSIDIETLESRLDVMFKCRQKYHTNTLESLLDKLDEFLQEKEALLSLNEDESSLTLELELAKKQCLSFAEILSKVRQKGRVQLSALISSHLKDLHFDYVDFDIEVNYNDLLLTETGCDNVVLMISTNLGFPKKPLQDVASGGELSRIMLALQLELFKNDDIPTYVFDEIDTGVGGIAATKVGDFLSRISKGKQVLCVTHLAQIAQFADHHLLVEKVMEGVNTVPSVSLLTNKKRQDEFKRMVGGESLLNHLSKVA